MCHVSLLLLEKPLKQVYCGWHSFVSFIYCSSMKSFLLSMQTNKAQWTLSAMDNAKA